MLFRSANGSGRLFEVLTNGALVISNLTLTGGFLGGTDGTNGADGRNRSNSGDDGGNGSAGESVVGGAVYNAGILTLIQCRLLTNSVAGGFGGDGGNGGSGYLEGGNGGNGGAGGRASGGAIYNIGSLLASNCTFAGNSAIGGDAGFGGDGGGGGFPGDAGNGAAGAPGSGGAIYNLGVARIHNSSFIGNSALGGYSSTAGTKDSNTGRDGATGGSAMGGGIYNSNSVQLVNCTFANNSVLGGNGGNGGYGFFQGGDGGNGGTGAGGGVYSYATTALTNCTLSGNFAKGGTNGVAGTGGFPGSDGSMGASRGGNIARDAGSFVLANSLLASPTSGGNGYGTITDAGYNVSSDNSVNLTATGSLKNTDPKLSAIGEFGGPTLTFMPQIGSPAIDRGSAGACLTIDQRGVSRPAGLACDSGAVESQGLSITSQPQSLTVAEGFPAAFTVAAAGELPLTYRWRYNNTNIVSATNTSYSLSNAGLTNAGDYRVVVSNITGSVTSEVAVLKVLVTTSINAPWLLNQTNFALSYTTRTGQIYVLQFKDNLAATNWTNLRTNAGNGSVLTNLQSITGTSNGFFRVLVE